MKRNFQFMKGGDVLSSGSMVTVTVRGDQKTCVVAGWVDGVIVLVIPEEIDGVVEVIRGVHTNRDGFYEPDRLLPIFCAENSDIDWDVLPTATLVRLSMLMH